MPSNTTTKAAGNVTHAAATGGGHTGGSGLLGGLTSRIQEAIHLYNHAWHTYATAANGFTSYSLQGAGHAAATYGGHVQPSLLFEAIIGLILFIRMFPGLVIAYVVVRAFVRRQLVAVGLVAGYEAGMIILQDYLLHLHPGPLQMARRLAVNLPQGYHAAHTLIGQHPLRALEVGYRLLTFAIVMWILFYVLCFLLWGSTAWRGEQHHIFGGNVSGRAFAFIMVGYLFLLLLIEPGADAILSTLAFLVMTIIHRGYSARQQRPQGYAGRYKPSLPGRRGRGREVEVHYHDR